MNKISAYFFAIINHSDFNIEQIIPSCFQFIFFDEVNFKLIDRLSYLVNIDQILFKTENNNITLSEKETKALTIFADNINLIVEREKLMKEIWEDKGIVVISRNVDVVVSKLRKKLSGDTSIKFINAAGRSYKFIIG